MGGDAFTGLWITSAGVGGLLTAWSGAISSHRSGTRMSENDDTKSPFGPGFIAACIVVGAILICGVALVFGGATSAHSGATTATTGGGPAAGTGNRNSSGTANDAAEADQADQADEAAHGTANGSAATPT